MQKSSNNEVVFSIVHKNIHNTHEGTSRTHTRTHAPAHSDKHTQEHTHTAHRHTRHGAEQEHRDVRVLKIQIDQSMCISLCTTTTNTQVITSTSLRHMSSRHTSSTSKINQHQPSSNKEMSLKQQSINNKLASET